MRSSKKRKKSSGAGFVVFMALLTLAAVTTMAVLALRAGEELAALSALPVTGEAGDAYIDDYTGAVYSDETFTYADEVFTAYEGVRRNEYDPEGFYFSGGRMGYTDPETGEEALLGIDVSSHQEEIDWYAVKADGIEFAMIRVGYRGNTEGKLNLDNRFQNNMLGAAEAGVPVGIYFYAQAIDVYEAREEAAWVLEQIEPYEIAYPVVYDWEYVGDPTTRTANTDGLTIDRCAEEFCDIIAAAGYTPMVYFNRELAYRSIDLYRLQKYDFWLAEYNETPTFFYGFEMLQYSYTGRVDGIEGGVDMNLCFADYLGG
ncbi:MAG: glycoside hydrolase family 25 protein [Oscillospiraceae bacterium]|nr:glycoside hydrolase family 25 protein [Oscillospiraceae bacterium]